MKTNINQSKSNYSRQPFFYDVTLRDGNQALKNPWSLAEKEIIFEYYDSITGKGLGAKQFAWSAAFIIEFILNF